MTPAQQLRTRINEILPDRVKLEFGCEVVVDCGEYQQMTVVAKIGVCPKHKTRRGCENADCMEAESGVWVAGGGDGTKIYDEPYSREVAEDKIKEILGKPLSYGDILRVIWALSEGSSLFNSVDTALRPVAEFDLSKDPEAPENSDACAQLLTLLEK